MVRRPQNLNIHGRMGFLNEGLEQRAAGAAVRSGAAGRCERVHAPRPAGDQAANGPIRDAIAETHDHGLARSFAGIVTATRLARSGAIARRGRIRPLARLRRAAVSCQLGIPKRSEGCQAHQTGRGGLSGAGVETTR